MLYFLSKFTIFKGREGLSKRSLFVYCGRFYLKGQGSIELLSMSKVPYSMKTNAWCIYYALQRGFVLHSYLIEENR